MSFRDTYVIEPRSRVHLDDIDPAQTGKHGSETEARSAIAEDLARLTKLQYRLYAENERSLLIVLQAPDAGGKDGTVRHVFGALNPQGASVHAFKVPTAAEAAHDFLWRIHAATPAYGQITIFNRSHYEDVLVPRVHRTLPKETIAKRYDRINEFEKNLVQSGTVILKFYLHISPDEQLRRFEERLDDPRKQWKISDADYAEREHWNDYRKAFEDTFERTSTRRAPWFVIPANHKWFRNLAVARIVTDTLDDLDMKYPKPTVDLEEMRQRYHAALEKLGQA
jgi:PPK2 family polyphosphate:nucleotide phosphotransferase